MYLNRSLDRRHGCDTDGSAKLQCTIEDRTNGACHARRHTTEDGDVCVSEHTHGTARAKDEGGQNVGKVLLRGICERQEGSSDNEEKVGCNEDVLGREDIGEGPGERNDEGQCTDGDPRENELKGQ